MFNYLVKYNGFTVKICINKKENILNEAIKELQLLTEIDDHPMLWAFDKDFNDFYIVVLIGSGKVS